MSETINDQDQQHITMISAKQRADIEIGDDDSTDSELFCSYTYSNGNVDYAYGNNKLLLICDGNSDKKSVKRRFSLEFVIKKIFYHTFISSRNIEKVLKNKKDSVDTWKESTPKQRDFLVVCGEHRLQFISLVDYHFYHYEIPFKLSNVFSVSHAVLVERLYDPMAEQPFHYHDTFHLYSLSGPFGELLPVIYKTKGFQPQWKFCWQSHHDDVEMVGTDKQFVVVFDKKELVHRVYMSRDTEEKEVQSALQFVETQRRNYHDSTLFASSSVAPHSSTRTPRNPAESTTILHNTKSPSMIALSEVINSEVEGRSPALSLCRVGFDHSTPNNHATATYQGILPTPIFEGGNDSKIWASTPGTPRVTTRGGLERNIHTRSLARSMAQDDRSAHNSGMPGPSSAQSPFSSGLPTPIANTLSSTQHRPSMSHTQKWRRQNGNAELLREFTRMIRDTPKKSSRSATFHEMEQSDIYFGDLERDPDVDLLLSKICLECVYVEPKSDPAIRANKAFVSRFLTQQYLNIVSHDSRTMKIIPVWNSSKATQTKLRDESKNKVVSISCTDGAFVTSSGLTATLDDDNTIVIYGGNEKVSILYVPNNPIQSGSKIFSFGRHSFGIIQQNKLTKIELPVAVECKSTHDLLGHVFVGLPLALSQQLLRKWRAIPRTRTSKDYSDLERLELREIMHFLFESVGINIKETPNRERSTTPEVGGKQMRPRSTPYEMRLRMQQYAEECNCEPGRISLQSDGLRTEKEFVVSIEKSNENFIHARSLLFALHGQFEEWSFDILMHPILPQFVTYAFILSQCTGESNISAYYQKMFPFVFQHTKISYQCDLDERPAKCHEQIEALSIVDKICNSIQELSELGEMPSYLTQKTLQLFIILAAGSQIIYSNAVLECRLWLGMNWARRLGLNEHTVKVFVSILSSTKSHGPAKASSLMELFGFSSDLIDHIVLGVRMQLLKFQAEAFAGANSLEPRECMYANNEENGLIWSLRWPNDIRTKNVEAMLDSSKPVLIATNVIRRDNESNIKELQDRFLTHTSYRYFVQSFGRAFFYFRTDVPSLLTTIDIPHIALGGVLYPARVTCDPPSCDSFRFCTEWSTFYNCCAAALRIGSSDMIKIEGEWMLMVSKFGRTAPAVAGLTFGFGLNGHLANMNMYHAHQQLATFDRFHSVALLLGLAASKFTTCDIQVYKILATYLNFLMGPTPLEIKLDCTIQTAAVSALGLLFADSGNMNIAKKLANEIGKAPNPEDEPVADRVSYKLSSGFALGLIMLGKGNGVSTNTVPFQQKIPSLSERLIIMMNGGLTNHCVFLPQNVTPIIAEVTNLPFAPTGSLMSANQTPNHTRQTDFVNIHLSSQAATIALGFMFMKTGNPFIAEKLALPNSITDIEKIRPDFIYTRVISHCLVMWDEIELSQEWIESTVPRIVHKYLKSSLSNNHEEREFHNEDREYWNEIIDETTMCQTYLWSISAACMALALKFSSCDGPCGDDGRLAQSLIEYYTLIVVPDQTLPRKIGTIKICEKAGAATISSVFSILVLAQCILKAGTGCETAMKYARLLRMSDRPDSESYGPYGKKYFEQMASHQALGMLLMGQGRYGFKRDNLSVALTVISTMPVVPQNIADNTHYHQPLRFFWTLAVEPRLLIPIDVAESSVIKVDCLITLKKLREGSMSERVEYKVITPYLLPPLEEIQCLTIGGGRYEICRINLSTPEEIKLMKEILSIGQGRVKLKKFSTGIPGTNDDVPFESFGTPIDIQQMLLNDHSSVPVMDHEIQNMSAEFEKLLNLNGSEEYPQVQSHLNTFREVVSRTSKDLIGLQAANIELAKKLVDGWPDEVQLSYQLGKMAQSVWSQ